MNAQDLRKKEEGELREELSELLKEQFNLRMQRGIGQLVRPTVCGVEVAREVSFFCCVCVCVCVFCNRHFSPPRFTPGWYLVEK